MANNYAKILELANKNNMGLSNTINRDYGIPLDYSSVQKDYATALEYAKNNTLAYIGQPISVGDALYIVTDEANGYLKEVGRKPEGDNHSITVAEDGKVSIKGFEAAANNYLPQVKVVDGVRELNWVPISAVIQADGNTRTVVEAADGSAITVTEVHDDKTDTYTYTLDVEFPAPAEYSVKKTVNEDGSVTYNLTKDGTVVGEDIVVHKAYDDSTLTGRVAAVESTVGGHTTAINDIKAQVDAFFGAVEDPDEIVNTLAEIQAHITSDESGAATMLADIGANKRAIETLNGDANTAGSVAKQIADAVDAHATSAAGAYATKDALAAVKATADAAAVKSEVDTALAGKADASALSAYRTIADSYSISEIDAKLAGIKGEYGETADTVAGELAAHKTANEEAFAAVELKQGQQDTAIQKNADDIAAINDAQTGIKAQAIAAAAENTQQKVNALATGTVASNTSRIADLETNYTSVSGQVTNLNAAVNGENGLSGRVGALETAKVQLETKVGANEGSIKAINETIADHTTSINALSEKDTELAGAIAANTEKFNNYSTTTQVEAKIDEKIAAIDNTERDGKIQKNADNIAAEVTRATTEEARIAGLVTANDTAVKSISGQVSELNTAIQAIIDDKDGTTLNSIKDLAVWVEEHESEVLPAIEDNTEAIAILNGDVNTEGSVQKIVADAIANIPAIEIATSSKTGVVMGSEHISIESNGAMKINMNLFNTDNLQQGSKTLVLNGGSAS